jgi:hypothetical protein
MMNKQAFKQFILEFRLMNTDTWGNAMDAWFEAVGRMYERGMNIPSKYSYSPGLSPTEEGCYFHEMFIKMDSSTLVYIAEFMYRYCRLLTHFKKNY